MALLIVAALLWLGLHIGVSGTSLRDRLVGALGERTFRAVFSLLALAFLALLAFAYRTAETRMFWYAPPWFVAVMDVVMLLALVLLAAAFLAPRGIARVTRHPLMSALGLWALMHLLANGDTASLVFFGTFLLTVLVGVPSQDAKLRRRDPAKAAELAATTSRLPFAAILAGRNRFAAAEIGWLAPLAGVVGWAVLIYLHPLVIGVPALPLW